MKYYVIREVIYEDKEMNTKTVISKPLYIVEHEEVAKHFCEKNKPWYDYQEYDTEVS